MTDDVMVRRPPGRPMATGPVTPCARCGTTAGRIHPTGLRPMRMSGAAYGVTGAVCHACHSVLYRKSRVVARCAGCGTDGGRSRTAGGRPLRYDGARFGREGRFCHGCVTTDETLARAAFARLSTAASASASSDASAVRAAARAIRDAQFAAGDAIEARRRAAIAGGPVRAGSQEPQLASAWALRAYLDTSIGRHLWRA